MHYSTQKLAALALLASATFVIAGCESEPKKEEPKAAKGERTTIVAATKGEPGGVYVETYTTTATVTAIDATERKVTLLSADGSKTDFKAGPEVRNFPQIKVGDKVKATATEQVVVYLQDSGSPASSSSASAIALAPKGSKPGVVMANTVEVTATLTVIDIPNHRATLKFPDGTLHNFAVRPDVDMTKAKLGQQVVIRATEAIAIVVVEAP